MLVAALLAASLVAPVAGIATALALGGAGALPYGLTAGIVAFEALFQTGWAIAAHGT